MYIGLLCVGYSGKKRNTNINVIQFLGQTNNEVLAFFYTIITGTQPIQSEMLAQVSRYVISVS